MGGLGRVLKFANDPWRVRWNPHEANEKVAAKRRERKRAEKERKEAGKARLATTNPGLFTLKKEGFLQLICIRISTRTHTPIIYIMI